MLSHSTNYLDEDIKGQEIFSLETGGELVCLRLDLSGWLEGVSWWRRMKNSRTGTGSVFVLPASCFQSGAVESHHHRRPFLGWELALVGKAEQCLYFLWRLRRGNLSQNLLVNFYKCTTESILTKCMAAWYSSFTKADNKAPLVCYEKSTGPYWHWAAITRTSSLTLWGWLRS